jgi:23S rRNA (adenine2503-C2)-methyltransferase
VKPDVRALTKAELEAQFKDWGEPAYRASQLLEWLYARRALDWEAMTNLPKSLREKLGSQFSLGSLDLVRLQGSRDRTQKFLWRLGEGSLVESVLIPANPALYGEPSDRHTLCVSTQVGCAYGCEFCASGLDGWKRNLRPDEIIEQVLGVERWAERQPGGEPPSLRLGDLGGREPEAGEQGSGARPSALRPRLIDNLVIMGMGEPLANYENLLQALRILNAPWGGGIGARKITVSTSGLAPEIRRLADEKLQCRLAISLHGATDEIRNRIMPVNRKYPLRELSAACSYYQEKKGRMITLEYILIAGVNDGLDAINPLAAFARKQRAKVNLIPYNTVQGLPWQRPDERTQERFLAALVRLRVTATLRREKGHDIDAACGQLRLKTERELARGKA